MAGPLFSILYLYLLSLSPLRLRSYRIPVLTKSNLLQRSVFKSEINARENYKIELCDYVRLFDAADMMAREKLKTNSINGLMCNLYGNLFAKELIRLQSTYPYTALNPTSDDHHHSLVAVLTATNSTIAYVDFVFRPSHRTSWRQFIPPNTAYVSDLIVRHDYRDQGIASKLLRACEAICSQLNSKNKRISIFLLFEANETNLWDFYTKNGYQPSHLVKFGTETMVSYPPEWNISCEFVKRTISSQYNFVGFTKALSQV